MIWLDSLSPDHRATVERVENWAAWSRSRPGYQSARSLEGRYRPPKDDDDRLPQLVISTLDALAVQRAIAPDKGAPAVAIVALSGWFIERLRADDWCAYMRRSRHPTRPALLSEVMRSSLTVCHNRLKRG